MSDQDSWLRRFHAGERALIERLYVDHFAVIDAAIAGIVRGPDRETVIHDVFTALLSRPETRHGFQGGSIAAWLRTLARNRAIDVVRRRQREQVAITDLGSQDALTSAVDDLDVRATARRRLAEFRITLPEPWRPLFDLRFVQQLSQREAARVLAVARTTLAYRELQIVRRLRRFVLDGPDV